jgi:hypothetical protein
MFIRRMVAQALILSLWFAASLAQQTPAPLPHFALREFRLTLQQSIESGKTKIGTKVQAKLAADTLFDGALIPKNAVASGVVVESESKRGKNRARLAIRMNTLSWNGGWAPLGAYLMPLYYPTTWQAAPNPPDGSPDPDSRTMNGAGQSGSPMNRQFPGNGSEASQGAIPDIPTTSNHPVRMRDVALAPTSDGGIALVSEHANIKLYKLTTYVFAADESSAK